MFIWMNKFLQNKSLFFKTICSSEVTFKPSKKLAVPFFSSLKDATQTSACD